MSENIKETESKHTFLDSPKEAHMLKSEMNLVSAFDEQLNAERLREKISSSRIKESATRIRSRLNSGRGIF